jgi:pimeloyl-ACP methyl ester carboxylesterase
MHYRIAGDGPPVLLLHPNSFSSQLFERVIPLLSDRYMVIAPDRFGHGQSDPLPPDFPDYAEGMNDTSVGGRIEPYLAGTKIDLLDALGIDEVFVVGQHTGSHVAIELAIRHPERVRKLVLVSITDWLDDEDPYYVDPPEWVGRPTPYLHVSRLEVARATRHRLVDSRSIASDGSHLVALWQMREEQQAGPLTTPEIMQKIALMAVASIPSWPETSPQVMLYYRAGRRLPLVRVPTLIMAGANDKAGMFTRQQRALLPSDVPSASEIVDDAGAFFALELPTEFANRVASWLGG